MLDRVLPTYDHHAGQHFLGRQDSCRLIGSLFIRLIYKQKSPSQSIRSQVQTFIEPLLQTGALGAGAERARPGRGPGGLR